MKRCLRVLTRRHFMLLCMLSLMASVAIGDAGADLRNPWMVAIGFLGLAGVMYWNHKCPDYI